MIHVIETTLLIILGASAWIICAAAFIWIGREHRTFSDFLVYGLTKATQKLAVEKGVYDHVKSVEIDLTLLPRKANKARVKELLQIAEEKEYRAAQFDYLTGMIKFVRGDVAFSVYTTTFTCQITYDGKQVYHKNCELSEIDVLMHMPKNYI